MIQSRKQSVKSDKSVCNIPESSQYRFVNFFFKDFSIIIENKNLVQAFITNDS